MIAPVEYRERLYWLEQVHNASDGNLETGDLLSTNLDGSDRQVALALRNGKMKPVKADALMAHRGKLYLLLGVQKPVDSSDVPTDYYERPEYHQYYLAHVQPDHQPSLAGMLPLPGNFHSGTGYLDGDYFYFTVREDRKSWLDWLSGPSTAKAPIVLYRLHLPD